MVQREYGSEWTEEAGRGRFQTIYHGENVIERSATRSPTLQKFRAEHPEVSMRQLHERVRPETKPADALEIRVRSTAPVQVPLLRSHLEEDVQHTEAHTPETRGERGLRAGHLSTAEPGRLSPLDDPKNLPSCTYGSRDACRFDRAFSRVSVDRASSKNPLEDGTLSFAAPSFLRACVNERGREERELVFILLILCARVFVCVSACASDLLRL